MTEDEQHQRLVKVTIDVTSDPAPDLIVGYDLLERCEMHYGPLRENQATVEDGRLQVTFTTRTKYLSISIEALTGFIEREIRRYDVKHPQTDTQPRSNLVVQVNRSY